MAEVQPVLALFACKVTTFLYYKKRFFWEMPRKDCTAGPPPVVTYMLLCYYVFKNGVLYLKNYDVHFPKIDFDQNDHDHFDHHVTAVSHGARHAVTREVFE